MLMKRLLLTAVVGLIGAEAASAACGCTSMTLKYRNAVGGATSSTYCVDSTENFSECTAVVPNPCGAGKKGWTCPIGGAYGNDGNPWIGIGFEVEATIPGGTNLSDCIFGQGIQRDISVNGASQPNGPTGHGAPTGIVAYAGVNSRLYSSTAATIPNLGATDANGRLKLASDNYSAVSSKQTIAYSGGVLRWSDLPSIYVDGDTAKTVKLSDRMLAFVRDSASGTVYCACKFLLSGKKNAGGDSLSAATLTQETGLNCVYSPQ